MRRHLSSLPEVRSFLRLGLRRRGRVIKASPMEGIARAKPEVRGPGCEDIPSG